jgi:hypothetical protein
MPKRKGDFEEDVRIRVLLWCDRHCCLCKKACGVDIEVAHLEAVADGGSGDIDNAIPLCYDCHAKIGHYNKKQPKGSKYKMVELKVRRNQVYEEFTRHLVPRVDYQVTQAGRTLPDVGFVLHHLGDGPPAQVRTQLDIKLGPSETSLGPPPDKGHYAGEKLWRLNPGFAHRGHFTIPEPAASSEDRLEVEVRLSIIDVYEREHDLLPVGWVYKRDSKSWYFEP